MSQGALFGTNIDLQLPEADIFYADKLFSAMESLKLLNALIEKVVWKHESIKLFGKTLLQPRLTAFYGEGDKPYSYSNITMQPRPWFEELSYIKNAVEDIANHDFSSVLINYYRTGSDSMGWHSDDEQSLGENPTIASVSLGAERKFMFKHKTDKALKKDIILGNGSLLMMKGPTQHHWLHQLPKTKKPIGPRLNLTFRKLK